MSVVTPEIRFFADCHWLMADNIILLRITPMLPYEWSNLRRLFDCKSTFETRSGPFDYWRIRREPDSLDGFRRLVASENNDLRHRL